MHPGIPHLEKQCQDYGDPVAEDKTEAVYSDEDAQPIVPDFEGQHHYGADLLAENDMEVNLDCGGNDGGSNLEAPIWMRMVIVWN